MLTSGNVPGRDDCGKCLHSVNVAHEGHAVAFHRVSGLVDLVEVAQSDPVICTIFILHHDRFEVNNTHVSAQNSAVRRLYLGRDVGNIPYID